MRFGTGVRTGTGTSKTTSDRHTDASVRFTRYLRSQNGKGMVRQSTKFNLTVFYTGMTPPPSH